MSKSVSSSCTVCTEGRKSRYRDFSPHAWHALVTWGELGQPMVGQAMCDGCYVEFRDILIERAEEVSILASKSAHAPSLTMVHEISTFTPASDAQIAS